MARWEQRQERSAEAIDAYLREHQEWLLAIVNSRVHELPDGRWSFSREDFGSLLHEYGVVMRRVYLDAVLSALFDEDMPNTSSSH